MSPWIWFVLGLLSGWLVIPSVTGALAARKG